MSDFERAKNLLFGAVDTVLSLASQANQIPTAGGSGSSSVCGSQSSSRVSQRFAAATQNRGSVIEEHSRLFGYKPSKGKRLKNVRGTSRRKGSGKWKKDCICLRDKDETRKPSSEKKVELAKMGLGLSEVFFDNDGDAEHIHRVVLTKFPVLESCGGYTLMRLAEKSSRLVEIEGSESGITVPFLKDILNHAKLFIRPLQKDITEEDMKEHLPPLVRGAYTVYTGNGASTVP